MKNLDISKMENISVDCVLSIGPACKAAYHIQKNNLRYFSSPFDWMLGYELDNAYHVLKNKGIDFFKNIKDYPEKSNINYRWIVDTDNNFIDLHNFPKNMSIPDANKNFLKRMNKRFKNLDCILQKANSICFLSHRSINAKALEVFGEKLNQLYNFKKIYLINIHDSNKCDVIKSMVNENLTIYEIFFNDHNKNGDDPNRNPAFWIGNNELWDKVLKKININNAFKQNYINERKNMTKISIIIPVYNIEQYLSKCLESAINQTYKNLEILCINDGSTDNSLNILEDYAKKDNRIKILNKENGGLSSARNYGLDNATGEYCYFLDSDDWIELDTIEILVDKMLNNKVDCVVHRVINIAEDESCKEIAKNCQEWFDGKNRPDGIYDVPINISQNIASVAWNKLYKMSIINEYYCRFPEGLVNEDEAFIWTYMIHCKNYYFINKCLYNYLRRSNSIMGLRDNSPKVLDILKIQKIIFETVKKYKNIDDYKEVLADNYYNDLYWFWKRMPKKYKNDALKLIKNYTDTANNDKRIVKEYYLKKYEAIYKIINNIFSVKNSKKHKVITILGIKFKFKSKKLLKRICSDENSFLEDIFSVKNHDIRKIITILGIKFKLKSKKLIKQKRWQELQDSINYANHQLQEQAKRYNETISELNNKLNQNIQKQNELENIISNKFNENNQKLSNVEKIVNFNRDEIKNNFDITCELLVSSLSQGESKND